ncbi:TetR/AcrR family transcriptional regulator [Herbihabitans rhizosphaerae]|uniref:TetR/AcrR family transcriptional regulator n=1 Tax=Herbihabitans rhizosphaerae TaxID=1872711 RepID=UPI00102CCDCE|nr:TetR/AcrR family transcriptional regulator [Herbihabitans rhizosphaerae]
MARPKTISDERILDACGAVITANGPGFTLAEVAERAGVSVGTVAQRFGSKLGLLRALSRQAIGQAVDEMRAAAEHATDPVAAVREAAVAAYSGLGDAEEAANNLGVLAIDLADPELRALLGDHYAARENELRALLRAAAGELPHAPSPAVAARVLHGLVGGISMDWSVRPHGTLADRLRQDVDAVLDGWRR